MHAQIDAIITETRIVQLERISFLPFGFGRSIVAVARGRKLLAAEPMRSNNFAARHSY
jgi:hypothetical protein